MSITDELREWAKGSTLSKWTLDKLLAIADRIDAEHEAACAEAYGNGVMSVPIALDESAWVELPVDADGVPIHIGDAMVLQHEAKEKPYVVQSFTWDGEDWYFTCDEGFFNACGWHHHHAPTVEDVLADFSVRVLNSGHQWGLDSTEVIAEYAAKLRLAGSDAE